MCRSRISVPPGRLNSAVPFAYIFTSLQTVTASLAPFIKHVHVAPVLNLWIRINTSSFGYRVFYNRSMGLACCWTPGRLVEDSPIDQKGWS